MKIINYDDVVRAVKEAFIYSTINVDDKTLAYLKKQKNKETNNLAKSILSQIIENDTYAKIASIPLCQDTGIATIFVEIGNEVYCPFDLTMALNEGVREAYTDGYLRKSVVSHPLLRKNSFDNTPAIIHYNYVLGDKLKITCAPKGAGSENMSALKMLNPTDTEEKIIDFAIETVKNASGKPCPPIIVGIGIGGNFEECALLAKKAVLRDFNDQATDDVARGLEEKIFTKLNELNIGPMGLKGDTTALAVKVNLMGCHIASLPVAINIQCHASRHKEIIL